MEVDNREVVETPNPDNFARAYGRPENDLGPEEGYPINIKALSRGYLVTVGCQEFAFVSQSEMIGAIEGYLDDPQRATKLWNENKILPGQ